MLSRSTFGVISISLLLITFIKLDVAYADVVDLNFTGFELDEWERSWVYQSTGAYVWFSGARFTYEYDYYHQPWIYPGEFFPCTRLYGNYATSDILCGADESYGYSPAYGGVYADFSGRKNVRHVTADFTDTEVPPGSDPVIPYTTATPSANANLKITRTALYSFHVTLDSPSDITYFGTCTSTSTKCTSSALSFDGGNAALDLSVGTLKFTQNGIPLPLGSDHYPTANPNSTVQINIPVSGSGFGTSESRSTTLLLQVGNQLPQSKSVSLADIKSAGTLWVPFNVTFGPQDTGTQSITATINSQYNLPDSDYSNNVSRAHITVGTSYKLVAFLDGKSTPIPDSGGSLTLVPSVKACGLLKDKEDGDTDIEIRCVQANDPTFLPVSGCKFILDLSEGPDSGGHDHNDDDESRPFVLDPLSPSFPVTQWLSVDSKGKTLTYTPPEVAGDVYLQVAGTDPNGTSISGPSYLFHVQDTDLGQLVNLNGAGAGSNESEDYPGISVVTDSHPGAGIYGTKRMKTAVEKMVSAYYGYGYKAGFIGLTPLNSQAATMVFGGLFDTNWNGAIDHSRLTPWMPPHCTHRDGESMDLSILNLDSDEKLWLQLAATKAGFELITPGENPKTPDATHWHAKLKPSAQ